MPTAFRHTEVFDAGSIGDKPRVDSVEVRWEYDPHADVSYLEREPDEDYYSQDKARLQAYYAGDWHMEGCTAVALCSYPIGNGSRRLEEFTSGGLWGIESDRTREYSEEVALEELADLKSHLETFGIDTASFWSLAPVQPKNEVAA